MSDEGMSDAHLKALAGLYKDADDSGMESKWEAIGNALCNAYPLIIARLDAAERERDTETANFLAMRDKRDAANERVLQAERERDALREALRPFADMLDALENLGGMAKTGAWYIAESSVSGPREITFEHYHAARAALTANHSAPVVEG